MCANRTTTLVFALLLNATLAAAADRDLRLIDAVKKADAATVAVLLERGIDVNGRAADGTTALHWAVYHDDLGTIGRLIRAGAHVNAATDLDITPLWIACTNASTAAIAALLDAGANPNLAPATNGTPVMIASRTGNVDAVRLLAARGADVNRTEASRGQSALMWAVSERHPDVVRALLDRGANVHARSKPSRRYVLLCCQEFEGDPDGGHDVDEGGFTPLLFAARVGDVDSGRLLLSAGADLEETAPSGTAALVVAAHSDQPAFTAFLLDHGANANADGGGYTALHAAVLRGNLPSVRALLAHGANPNARQRNGTAGKRYSGIGLDKNTIGASPYLLATRSGQLDIMRALKASGADVNLGLADGTTPVMAAAVRQGRLGRGIPENRIVQTIQLAIELGSDIKGASRDGDTALHVAAKRRLDTVIEFLIDHGAPVNARNGKGQTPLAVALAPVPPAKGAGQQTFDEYTFLSSHAAATAALLRKLGATE